MTVECICTHFTEFTVLSQSTVPGTSCPLQPQWLFYLNSFAFSCLAFYCFALLFSIARVRAGTTGKLEKDARKSVVVLHVLILAYALARLLAALRWAGALPSVGIISAVILSSVSYFLLFFSFVRLIVLWASMHHYAMQADGQLKMRRMGRAMGLLMSIFLTFTSLFLSPGTRLSGTASMALLYLCSLCVALLSLVTGIAFGVYAFRLSSMLDKGHAMQQHSPQGKQMDGQDRKECLRLYSCVMACCRELSIPEDGSRDQLALRFRRAGFLVACAFLCLSMMWLSSMFLLGAPVDEAWLGFSLLLALSFALEGLACVGVLFLYSQSARDIFKRDRDRVLKGRAKYSEVPKETSANVCAPSMAEQETSVLGQRLCDSDSTSVKFTSSPRLSQPEEVEMVEQFGLN